MSAEAAAAWYGATVATIVLLWDVYKWAAQSHGQAIANFVSKTLPLESAAQRFYEEAWDVRSFWAFAADGASADRTSTQALTYCAHAMKLGTVDWSGIHPPSKRREVIPQSQIVNCQFLNGLDTLMASDGRVYTSVRISKSGLRTLIARLKAGKSLGPD